MERPKILLDISELNNEPFEEEFQRFEFHYYNTWKTWKTDCQGFPIFMLGSFFEPTFLQVTLGLLGFCVTFAIYKKDK